MTLTCLLPFLSSDASGLCSSFFSGHYIPSGLISLISHWPGCQNSFLHYRSLLKGSCCWILHHIPFDLPWILFFSITSISFSFFVYPSGRKRGLIISMKPALLFVSKCWQTGHIYLKKERFSIGCNWGFYKLDVGSLKAGFVFADSLGRTREIVTSVCRSKFNSLISLLVSGHACPQTHPRMGCVWNTNEICCFLALNISWAHHGLQKKPELFRIAW